MNAKHVQRSKKYVALWRPLLDITRDVTVSLEAPEADEHLDGAFAVIYDLADAHQIMLNEVETLDRLRHEFSMGLEELIVHELLHIKTEPLERRTDRYVTDRAGHAAMSTSMERVLDELAKALVRTRRNFQRKGNNSGK